MFVIAIMTLYTAFIAFFLIRRLRIIGDIEEIPVTEKVLEPPSISVIVPLRNEERNARYSIESLLTQSYENFEVVAVDDVSDDGTLDILKDLASYDGKLKVVEGKPTPEGWVGKTNALWQGVSNSSGDWLLFVDADVNLDPRTLSSVMSYVKKNDVDMLSLYPRHILKTFWERAVQPVILSSIYSNSPPKVINDEKTKKAAAIGGFILIKRRVYDAIGGHEAVRDKIVEDFAIANLVKGSGYRLRLVGGENLIEVRWYKNFKELWEGWTKNLFFGLRRNWGRLILAITVLPAWGVAPIVIFIVSLIIVLFQFSHSTVSIVVFFESLFVFLLNIHHGWEITKIFGIPRYYVFALPLGVLIYTAIIISSAYKVVSGVGINWKGRLYKY